MSPQADKGATTAIAAAHKLAVRIRFMALLSSARAAPPAGGPRHLRHGRSRETVQRGFARGGAGPGPDWCVPVIGTTLSPCGRVPKLSTFAAAPAAPGAAVSVKPLFLVALLAAGCSATTPAPSFTATLTTPTDVVLSWPDDADGHRVEYAHVPAGPWTTLRFLPPHTTGGRRPGRGPGAPGGGRGRPGAGPV